MTETEELKNTNKYNAKTKTQYKFGERIEKEYGLICNFDFYNITRGRGWSKSSGSCSACVAVRDGENSYAFFILLYHPLKKYLIKKKFLSAWRDTAGLSIELEDTPQKKLFLVVVIVMY